MRISKEKIEGVYSIELDVFEDDRGGFARAYCKKELHDIGLSKDIVQINHSFNKLTGTIRGMHLQVSPYKEVKLIRCIKGSVLDVIVDLRKDSITFLDHFSIELSSINKRMILVPEGFAHGFQTLENDTELIYHHTEYFNPVYSAGFRYDDPMFEIEWPLKVNSISEKDKNHPLLNHKFEGI